MYSESLKRRLEKYGYNLTDVSEKLQELTDIEHAIAQIEMLPGVSKDPATHGAIDAIVKGLFGYVEDSTGDNNQGTEGTQGGRRNRTVVGKPTETLPDI